MKMYVYMRKGNIYMKKKLLSMFLLLSMLICGLITIHAENEPVEGKNIMLVIDGSGSLKKTDKEMLRIEAVKTFLGLLPESGSSIGAIVFDNKIRLNTGSIQMDSKKDKAKLISDIKVAAEEAIEASSSPDEGWTDIGNALLTAITELTQNATFSSAPNYIILFSDGETDLGNEAATKESLEKEVKAIKSAKGLSIPIYSVCLNTEGSVDTSEIKAISSNTSGAYQEVRNADNLNDVFEMFYSLIFGEGIVPIEGKTDSESNYTRDFKVPSVGIEELNLIIKTETSNPDISLTRPNGVEVTADELKKWTQTQNDNYRLIKMIHPDAGDWKLNIKGDPNSTVHLKWIYNTLIDAVLEIDSTASSYQKGDNVRLRGYLLENSFRITDYTSYGDSGYNAILKVYDAVSGEEITSSEMKVDGASFVSDVVLDQQKVYDFELVLVCGEIKKTSTRVTVGVGNTNPVANQKIVEKTVLFPFSASNVKFMLDEYVHDEEDEALTYKVGSHTFKGDALSIEDSKLTINLKGVKTGGVTVAAYDSQGGNCDITFKIKVINAIPLLIIILLAVILLLVLLKKKSGAGLLYPDMIIIDSCNPNGISEPYSITGLKGKRSISSWQIVECGLTGFIKPIPDTNSAKGKTGRLLIECKEKFITDYNQTPTNKVEININGNPEITIYPLSAAEDQSAYIHIMCEESWQ